jgi:hypothetical protein
MKTWEAVKALQEGKKVRMDDWCDNEYMFIDNNFIFMHEHGKNVPSRFEHTMGDWELYEEKPEIKKDKYVGKIAINKTKKAQGFIEVNSDGCYRVADFTYFSVEELKKYNYIEGEDF